VKPQLAFQTKPNNSDITPWKPLLTTKPHALIPLAESLDTFTNEEGHQQYDYTKFLPLLILEPPDLNPEDLTKSQRKNQAARRRNKQKRLGNKGVIISRTNSIFRYRHPYETEILEMQYPDTVYHSADPIPYLPFESTKATFVNTFESVLEMLEDLKVATEIAVDLEHHDARSYVGLVSLMQISTREKDWVVDTLKPWRQDLQVLNEVFANPKIIKVNMA
jgi:exosome complex exonuclease RRP6